MNPIESIAALLNLIFIGRFEPYINSNIYLGYISSYFSYGGIDCQLDINIGLITTAIIVGITIILAIYYLFDICILIYKRCTK